MLKFITKRIFLSIPTMFVLIALTFFIMKAVPGGPFDSENAMAPEIRAAIEKKFYLDRPTSEQFLIYVKDIIRFDLGPSYRYMGSRTVNEIIGESFPVSIQLGLLSLFFAIGVGIPLGAVAARFKGSMIDFSSMFIAIAGVSLPNYLLASILILVFSMWLGILPPALWEDWQSMILPAITLGARPMAMIARITRASLLDVLSSDFIRTAKAKGLSEINILFKHALKNALVPVLTLLGPLFAAVISGSFVVEMIFAIPGMGKHFVSAVIDRDYTLIMGLTIVYGILVVSANIIVDFCYALVDPRIRVEK